MCRVIVSRPLFAFVLLMSAAVSAEPITLVEDGKPRISIVAPAKALEADMAAGDTPRDLRLLRWAADDLRDYIKRISGATVQRADEPIDGLTPIYLGPSHAGDKTELGVSSKFGDAYAIDVTADRIVLTGESARASYYAAARLLHRLGVRWYAPGELGAHVPSAKTLRLETMHVESAPDFHTRNFWGKAPQEKRWLLRNRMGGPMIAQGHAFRHYMKPVDGKNDGKGRQRLFEQHPEYFPVINGEVANRQANLSNPEVAELFARHIRKKFESGPTQFAGGKSIGIGPDDGAVLDERPATQGIIGGRVDPMLRLPDATDLFVRFANRIARRLEDDFPDHKLGFYVYSNHAGVPEDEKPHEMLQPVIAPITFSRYSSIGNPKSPTSMLLEDIIKGWTELSPDVGCYLYNFNLADTAMPFTRTLAFGKSIPRLHAWGVRYASIESMTNWHTMVPGNYVIGNLLWDVEADREALEDEVYTNYFGPAADPMRQYNAVLEQAYENTDAYAGNLWSMHRILGPEVRQRMGAALQRAEQAVKGESPYEARVEVMRYSFNYAERRFAARSALNEFRLKEAAKQAEAFVDNYEQANEAYPLFFSKRNASYFEAYHLPSFKDARRVAEEGKLLYEFPDTWQAYFDDQMIGHRMGLGDPRSKTGNWTELKTYSATISDQGFPHFRGLIWYRHSFKLPAPEAGAQTEGMFGPPTDNGQTKLKLWFAGTDGPVHVYLNGEDLGRHVVRRFGPVQIDVTKAARPGAENTLIVAVDNTGIVELGTGGIMRPVAIYQTQ